jgi:hypothetical protein
MPPIEGIAIELGRKAAVGFGRDDCLNYCLRQCLTQPIRVECPIREQLPSGQPFDQRCRASQVVGAIAESWGRRDWVAYQGVVYAPQFSQRK